MPMKPRVTWLLPLLLLLSGPLAYAPPSFEMPVSIVVRGDVRRGGPLERAGVNELVGNERLPYPGRLTMASAERRWGRGSLVLTERGEARGEPIEISLRADRLRYLRAVQQATPSPLRHDVALKLEDGSWAVGASGTLELGLSERGDEVITNATVPVFFSSLGAGPVARETSLRADVPLESLSDRVEALDSVFSGTAHSPTHQLFVPISDGAPLPLVPEGSDRARITARATLLGPDGGPVRVGMPYEVVRLATKSSVNPRPLTNRDVTWLDPFLLREGERPPPYDDCRLRLTSPLPP